MDGTVISNIHFTKMVEVYVATNVMNYRKVASWYHKPVNLP